MFSNFSSFSRRGPDKVTEELMAALSNSKSYEFTTFSVSFMRLFGLGKPPVAARKCCGCARTKGFRTSCERVESRKPARNTRAWSRLCFRRSEEFRRKGPSCSPRRSLFRGRRLLAELAAYSPLPVRLIAHCEMRDGNIDKRVCGGPSELGAKPLDDFFRFERNLYRPAPEYCFKDIHCRPPQKPSSSAAPSVDKSSNG